MILAILTDETATLYHNLSILIFQNQQILNLTFVHIISDALNYRGQILDFDLQKEDIRKHNHKMGAQKI